jgi:hypothetical protein
LKVQLAVETSAATATATRGRSLFRSFAAGCFFDLAFDADDGKDQNGAHRFV